MTDHIWENQRHNSRQKYQQTHIIGDELTNLFHIIFVIQFDGKGTIKREKSKRNLCFSQKSLYLCQPKQQTLLWLAEELPLPKQLR
jgi:hypothetical protein